MNLFSLNQYIQRSKNYNRPNDFKQNNKLTKAQQELIQVGGSGSLIEVSDLEAIYSLISADSIEIGAWYQIPNVDTNLYGGTTILLQGLSSNKLSSFGYGSFFYPFYEDLSVWDPLNTYEIGDKVIYGGLVWTNLDNSTGVSYSPLILNESWQSLPPIEENSSYYNWTWDEITYDLENDFISSRFEETSGNYVSIDHSSASWFYCNTNPIQIFRWGHPFNGSTQRGVAACRVINSYMNNLNMINGYMTGIEVTNYSYIFDIQLRNGSYVQTVKLDNYSAIFNLDLKSSNLYGINVGNESAIYSITAENCTITDVIVTNGSTINQLSMSASSINNVKLYNDSNIGNFELGNSNFYNLDFQSSSSIYNGSLANSGFYGLKLSTSNIGNLTFNSSSLEFINLDNAVISNCNFTSSMGITASYFNSTYRDYSLITSGREFGSTSEMGQIKYQFELFLDGAAGTGDVGALNLPQRTIPNGYYIDKVILDADNLTFGQDSIINIGFTDNNTAGIDDAHGQVPDISNKITQFSVDNGKITPVKKEYNGLITGEIKNSSVSNGAIRFEVIIKKINENFLND